MSVDPAAGPDLAGYFPNRDLINKYVDILINRGIDWGLLGPRESDRIWSRHVLNSVGVARLMPQGSTVIDVGSGAGLPGIPVALYRPDLQVTLLEPLLRRSRFLEEAVEELGIGDRVTVVRARAEDVSLSADIVTARAVARLPKLLRWTRRLFSPAGELLALKGATAQDEIHEAAKLLGTWGLSAEVVTVSVTGAEETHVIRCREDVRV